jgi:hypothetical protein
MYVLRLIQTVESGVHVDRCLIQSAPCSLTRRKKHHYVVNTRDRFGFALFSTAQEFGCIADISDEILDAYDPLFRGDFVHKLIIRDRNRVTQARVNLRKKGIDKLDCAKLIHGKPGTLALACRNKA